jgi:glutamine synthetase
MEIGLKHRIDPLQACDEAMMFKRLVKGVAESHGLIASFMAKPYKEYTGCGMHIHISLADSAGNNLFAEGEVTRNPWMRHAIGGMQATMADGMAIFAPNGNSYRRFRKGSYAPIAPNWAVNNRTVSLRIPAGKGASTHFEHRVAGADANPYLVTAAVLAGVHHGLTQKLDPGEPVTGNGYLDPPKPRPTNWLSALDVFRRSTVIKDYLNPDFVDIFAAIKEAEADRFFSEPQAIDFEYYLRNI